MRTSRAWAAKYILKYPENKTLLKQDYSTPKLSLFICEGYLVVNTKGVKRDGIVIGKRGPA